jgi:putative addiction module component (TIGR02574 family)
MEGYPMLHFEQFREQALALPPKDRALLAELLQQSLAADSFDRSTVAASWKTEIGRRLKAYDGGETQAEDAATAIQAMRRELARRTGQ